MEPEKILAFITVIQESEFEPDRLVVRYIAPETLKDDSGLTIVGISDWRDISAVDPIVELIDI